MGMFELMIMNDDLRDMIIAEASTDELRDACRKHGHAHPARGRPEGDLRRR